MDSLNHAKHNESVCNYLGRKDDFSDWVITTSFYSALHYVRHLMFPLTDNGKLYNDFETYFCENKSFGIGRHGFQQQYVIVHYPDINFEYGRLLEMSSIARYSNCVYTREQAKLAKDYLVIIKRFISSRKP
jgi:hypothetical protein